MAVSAFELGEVAGVEGRADTQTVNTPRRPQAGWLDDLTGLIQQLILKALLQYTAAKLSLAENLSLISRVMFKDESMPHLPALL